MATSSNNTTPPNIPNNGGLGVNFLPDFYQTTTNKKFLQATIDQLYQPGTITKTSGYIGRQNAKAATGSDIYVKAADAVRQNYQLEPGLVIKDSLNNVTFFKDYIDYINQIGVFGGNTKNHSRLNAEEFYSWDPHIDWDKFINFQDYYWLPYGPDSITIYGQQTNIESTYTVVMQSEEDTNEYLFTPNGLTLNPVLKLYRGQTYNFNISSPGNPFSIMTTRSTGIPNLYTDGVTNNGITSGTLTFTVPDNAPSLLYYQSQTDINLGGVIEVYEVEDASYLDIEHDILGKVKYTLPNGLSLSNGMKVAFGGNVTPSSYATGKYYVEGVGTAIKLVSETILEIVSPYTSDSTIEFDKTPFDIEPFDDATGFASIQDYIVINRASSDHNPWSRYNRWFHKDVITATANYNNDTVSLNQTARAVRPIIEFEADLKLFNLGTTAIPDINLIDNFTTDVFSVIEGSLGYNIDGVPVITGQRILFTADTDPLVKNNVYEVSFINIRGRNQIHLTQVSEPAVNQVVLVLQGIKNQSQMYWYDGSNWILGQQKTNTNQAPLFDMFDNDGISFSDTSTYNGSTFLGTKIFSYKVGTGVSDPALGFALSYLNVANIGDIVFSFDLATDLFEYKLNNAVTVTSVGIDTGYLSSLDYAGNTVFVNGWQICNTQTTQAAVRIYNNSQTNNFNIDIFNDINNLSDLIIKVYVNGIRVDPSLWSIIDGAFYKQVVFNNDINTTDILTIRAFSAQPINSNGYYEIPINLQNNPLNDSIGTFTLGEVTDHLNSIIDNLPVGNLSGVFPGDSNLRDLGNITQYGTKFVQHSGPLSLGIYHITSETNNIVKAIKTARDDYNSFKRNFITVASSLGVDGDPVTITNLVLEKLTANKPNTAPYNFSDMVPFGAAIITNLTVVDYRIKTYPLTNVFTLDSLSNKAVGVYWTTNGIKTQLVYGRDYTFSNQAMVVINSNVSLSNGDIITTVEYDSTDGCFVPETPTKLGIWPAFIPSIYLDTSLVSPQNVIQGHDGSVILAYGDYRDDLLLELETRIYNNIKVAYDPSIFDIAEIIPGYNRSNAYSLNEFNNVLAPSFYEWTGLVGVDFTQPLTYDRSNPFTYNYQYSYSPNGEPVPGYWRGIYRWMLDTDRPHLCPWEMLGFSVMPTWWTSVYGPAPYTSDNLVLWQDLSTGTVKDPSGPSYVLSEYVRPFLINHIPVDESGNLLNPVICGLASGEFAENTNNNFVFGDVSPVEAAWRRSSYYPFSILIASMLLTPAKTFGLVLDRSRVIRNLAGQLVYKDTGLRIRPTDITLPSIYASTNRVQTAGIINYVVNLIMNVIFSNNEAGYNSYANDLATITPQLSYRVGAFTNQPQFNLILESKTPLATGNVFVPQESYNIFLNTSNPVTKLTYSGVIITKLSTGWEIKGYSKSQPYFQYYNYFESGNVVNVGGISESYVVWAPNQQYISGQIVEYKNLYYYVTQAFISGTTFDSSNFTVLNALPIVGGVNSTFRTAWNTSTVEILPYGTQLSTVQQVVDFLLGYEQWLINQGFTFDTFNNNLGTVANWSTSAREFMFWTTQNWSTGEDKWSNWMPNQPYSYGTVVQYDGAYYSAQYNIPASDVFELNLWTLLPGLSTVGSSVISLSPAANGLSFTTTLTVVDSISNPFNDYEIFKVDGTPLEPAEIDSYRTNNTVTYSPRSSNGIYSASFYLIQNEHVVILDNTDIFNDVIYNPPSGYRRERLKLSGYVTANWYGGLDIPGFIFDAAAVQSWQPWQDYSMADIVLHQGNYYSAIAFTAGTSSFVPSDWTRLQKQPTAQLLPNWTNIATQFVDFYSLNVDNFNTDQQRFAQHLIGYQTRQYLNNIIQDPVSEFKFYQGMIRDKGTQNVLNHLFGVLNEDKKESLTFYEEWALRVGRYGASNAFEDIEIILDDNSFKNNPQGFYLTNSVDKNLSAFVIQQTPNDVYVKPLGYNSNPFPELSTVTTFLRSSGYVNPVDVTFNLGTISDITSKSVSDLTNGQYVWCAFEGASWNVYRFTDLFVRVTSVVASGTTVTISTENIVPFKTGSYIGLAQVESIQGFYQVDTVSLNTFTITVPPNVKVPAPFTQASELVVYALITQRTSSIDTLDSLSLSHISQGALVWTDTTSDGTWATWEYNPVFLQKSITNPSPASGFNFGKNLAVNKLSSILAVGNSQGTVYIYSKAGQAINWVRFGGILKPFLTTNEFILNSQFATVIGISNDGTWLATGSPTVGYVTTDYVGTYNASNTYSINQIVSVENSENNYSYYQALSAVPAHNVPSASSVYWNSIPYVPVDQINGNNSSLTNQGVISLYKKDVNNVYNLVDSIISPLPTSNENFGSNIVFGDNVLYVTAGGYNNNAGRVYKLSYQTVVHVVTPYNPAGSLNSTIVVSSTLGIRPGMVVRGIGFTSGQTVVSVLNSTTLTLDGSPNSTPAGVLSFVTEGWGYDWSELYTGASANSNLGKSIAISDDESTLLITSVGKVNIYKDLGTGFEELQVLTGIDTRFGQSIAVSSTGDYIAISDDTVSENAISQQGMVTVYNYATNGYVEYQTLVNHKPESNGLFGNEIAFMNDNVTIAVYSKNGSSSITTILDSDTTTFDKHSTNFVTTELNSGRVDIYDRYDNKWVFSESLASNNQSSDGYGTGFSVGNNQIIVGAPYALDSGLDSGQVYSYGKVNGTFSWNIVQEELPIPDVSKVKKAFLYDKSNGTLVTYLDVVDPLQGKIAGPAQEELTYQTFYDPASYSYSDGTVNVTVNSTAPWDIQPIGELWWDLRTTKFLENHFLDASYRNNTWNTLAPGASVDVYEWVSFNQLPSAWDLLADTPAGLAQGISGTSLYGNSAYSMTQSYDSISKTFSNKYYFWVKNKQIIPSNVSGRNMAASDVASLIENPRNYGYSCLALTGTNSFSLVNVNQFLKKSEIVLAVEYWLIDKTDQNVHSQWKLISDDPAVTIPSSMEQKWFDSLCGVDTSGRVVPDPSLPVKLKYGIENRPRQSMFVNRIEALKEFIERVNSYLISYEISESRDISALDRYDGIPNVITGLYDIVLDNYDDLSSANVGSFTAPTLTPIITNGRITGINIVNAGKGFVNAPYITIAGSGENAIVRTTINALGEITGATIINGGDGYNNSTQCLVRSYSVLITSDSTANGAWTIYAYDPIYKVWSKTLTQAYDVRNYWSYTDWYATGYNQFTPADYLVNTFADLSTITPAIGDIVKVATVNTGGWQLLECYSTTFSVDWTQVYNIIGIQNGTIQFSTKLYEFDGTNVGYDSSIFDASDFDVQASQELRIILNTIKNNILIDDLKQDYLDLFFSSIRYAHSEQPFIDWIFKTSFVRATHNVGSLNQPVNYPVNNLSNFQDYVAEVKPYRTKVREYIDDYTYLDTNTSALTDFDLQPTYENGSISSINAVYQNNLITSDDSNIQLYPWKFWLTNVGYSVTELIITNGGAGYKSAPVITISDPTGPNPVIATAKAYVANGVLNRILITSAGSGYLSAPTVTLNGGLIIGGTAATIVAIIGGGVVRTNLTELKFDRVDQTYLLAGLTQTDTFTGSGSQLQFVLTWAPDVRVGQSSVLINEIPVLRELYTLAITTTKSAGYTQYFGTITFDTAPSNGSTIVVNYNKDISVLNATDRIQFYYNPTTGQLGKDLTQLLTGIDYGGVTVTGLNFNVAGGWGSTPYLSDTWDSRDPSFEDYTVQVSANTHVFVLPYTPPNGANINVYYVRSGTFTYTSDGATTEYSFDINLLSPKVTVSSSTTTSSITTTYNPTGSVGYILKVSSTAGIVPGMVVAGNGFNSRQKVLRVADSTTLNMSAVPDSTPSGTLIFSNVAGTFIVSLSSIVGLEIGDTVNSLTVANDESAIGYGTTITEIDSLSNTITLSQILYSTIPAGTTMYFTRTLVEPTNVAIYANGTILLVNPPVSGATIQINGTYAPVRLDDPNFGTVNQTNANAIMTTPVVGANVITSAVDGGEALVISFNSVDDGGSASASPSLVVDGTIIDNNISNVIEIPSTFTVLDGDEFILRQSTSDGSIPSPTANYDSDIDGGDLAYSTATGLLADDIVVDGDGLVTPTSSPAPEEVVPGQVVDTLAIKVFDQSTSGSANIKVTNYITDGVTTAYSIGQTPNSNRAVIVKLGSNIETYSTSYTTNYQTSEIVFNTAPSSGQSVTIFSIGFSGSNILDIDYFVGDGNTTEFVTRADWNSSITSLVYVNGIVSSPVLFETDSTYDFSNAIGFKFSTPPAAGALINYIIVSGNQQTFAVTKSETVLTNGATTYTLQYPIGNALPNESNMIVRVDQTILQAPNNSYFTIGSNRLNYTVDPSKAIPFSVDPSKINVYAGGDLLIPSTDYTVDPSGITVKITKKVYSKYSGQQLIISIITNDGYSYNQASGQITFAQAYDNTHTVEIISNYVQDILDIQRTEIQYSSSYSLTSGTTEFYTYNNISGGLVALDRQVIDNNYVWVIKDSRLLSPTVDYKLNDDLQSITLSNPLVTGDTLSIITFGSNILPKSSISYMQFKDMLNRVTYIRLNANKQTTLAQDLRWNDTSIVVEDASNLDVPNTTTNKPGVIEIRGERIEYFVVNGNTLSQLRRGTLGTGVYRLNKAGSFVQGIGASEYIPYSDVTTTDTVISSGGTEIDIEFVPKDANSVTVFVGGYNNSTVWSSNTDYTVGDIVTVGPYSYRCVTANTSSDSFDKDSAYWTFFVANIRLQKSAYKMFNINKAPYSPAGDVTFPADFTVDGISAKITLTNPLSFGTQVTVVKQTGIAWDSSKNILNDTTAIGNFIKAAPGIWYTEYKS